jgi:hypothetical protein
MDEGDFACLLHSRWLSEAMRTGRRYPRIPTRPVITGGFAPLMNRANGPDLARRWWKAALARVD